MRTVYLVYQDCPLCGARKAWGEKQLKIASKKGIEIKKVGFTHPFVRENKLCMKAVAAGIPAMPFYTDLERFGTDISDFVTRPKRSKKVSKESEHADGDSESAD